MKVVKKSKSQYIFLWGDYQPLCTIETNINAFIKFKKILWNHSENIIQVSKNNKISCFHSKKDLQKDTELGKQFLKKEFSKKFIEDLERDYKRHCDFFNLLGKVDFSKLLNKELFEYLVKTTDYWSLIIGYFRATQAEGTYYLVKEIKTQFSDEEAAVLMIPNELDLANKERIDWQNLIKQEYSTKRLLEHTRKYPWIVPHHYIYDDVMDTLTQRYNFDKDNLNFKDLIKEKHNLKEKQENIINKTPQLRPIIKLIQRLVLSRMEVKSCWAGTDFYLIPLFEEIAKRTNESVFDINNYYLIDEIKQLLDGKKLSDEEKEKRKKCFVGLWKDGKVNYKSGDEAEKIAKEELKELYEIKKTDEIKGAVASPGKVVGIARILEANNVQQTRELRKDFKKGEILITQMTQPNVMDIAMRASAIVTDEGGLLSHAAIISREFGIPCIVGTSKATNIFRDGDMIEVDANKGIVRKMK